MTHFDRVAARLGALERIGKHLSHAENELISLGMNAEQLELNAFWQRHIDSEHQHISSTELPLTIKTAPRVGVRKGYPS